MDEYIFDTRKQISIINLEITQEHLSAAASKVEDICSKGNKILFVGTKRSASKTIKEEASEIGLPYVDKRWLGGTLTNWKTIRGSIRRLIDIEEMISSGRIEKLIKKEAVEIQKEYSKLKASVGGIKDMKGLPDAIFVVDVKYEKIAVLEAKKMGIPVIGIVDTNSDPDGIDTIWIRVCINYSNNWNTHFFCLKYCNLFILYINNKNCIRQTFHIFYTANASL